MEWHSGNEAIKIKLINYNSRFRGHFKSFSFYVLLLARTGTHSSRYAHEPEFIFPSTHCHSCLCSAILLFLFFFIFGWTIIRSLEYFSGNISYANAEWHDIANQTGGAKKKWKSPCCNFRFVSFLVGFFFSVPFISFKLNDHTYFWLVWWQNWLFWYVNAFQSYYSMYMKVVLSVMHNKLGNPSICDGNQNVYF